MQTVYNFDAATGVPLGVDNLRDDQTINPDHQTTVVPPENKSIKFDKAQQKWVEFTPPVDQVTAQLAELIKSNASQSALNAQLIKQVAALQAQLAASTTSTKQEAK